MKSDVRLSPYFGWSLIAYLIDNYTENCTITADLTAVPYSTAVNDDGATYYRFHYDIIMLFGQTELKAQLAWKENVRLSTTSTLHSSQFGLSYQGQQKTYVTHTLLFNRLYLRC